MIEKLGKVIKIAGFYISLAILDFFIEIINPGDPRGLLEIARSP